ncbi:unnamed protein product, partial [Porites lobata]
AEKDANCPNDYIEILDGSYGSTVVIARLCGFSLQDVDEKTFVSSSNMLLVHMHTDNDKQNRGFLAKHKGICDVRLTTLSGTISTTLTFHKFMLEKNEECKYDWLSVQEGNSTTSPEITRVCGDVLPLIIEAPGPVRIAFNTDGDKEFEGFHITYQAQGTCLDGVNNYSCICNTGFTGRHCNVLITSCSNDTCFPGVPCAENNNSISCGSCPSGFTGDGKNCKDIDDCASHPCFNNGSCLDAVNSYSCNCLEGFNGSRCEINIDDCVNHTCANGGSCMDGVNTYTCNCPPGFTGMYCGKGKVSNTLAPLTLILQRI